ncbi:MAG: hypothetical protein ACREA0_17450 [bacterium]
MNRFLAVACVALLVAACASGSTSSTNDVESLEIDGVWVFQHANSGGDDALHSGVAEIKNDCLYVNDAVVVWHEDQTDQASQLIASIKGGDEPQVSLPGGGTRLDEGDTPIAASITDLCPTKVLWYTRPGP